MTRTPMMVPRSIPPTAVVPIVRFPIAPGPVARTNGIRPAMKAKDVIRIGRKRNFPPSMAASLMLTPSWCRCTANSTIRIAFLPSSPTNMGVDVVGQPHDLQEEERSEDPDRQRQDHCQRQDETLVLPNQYQIDEDDYDQEDINSRVPLPRLVIREAF